MRFEILEHTADIGIRVFGNTYQELFASAAFAVQSLTLESQLVERRTSYPITVTGEDLESLLVNWLNEIIYFLDGKKVVFSSFDLELSDTSVYGQVWGEPRDPQRHPPLLVVKAATYHQLRLEREGDQYVAEVYLDI
jgi:SHS2 domain-containing protein